MSEKIEGTLMDVREKLIDVERATTEAIDSVQEALKLARAPAAPEAPAKFRPVFVVVVKLPGDAGTYPAAVFADAAFAKGRAAQECVPGRGVDAWVVETTLYAG